MRLFKILMVAAVMVGMSAAGYAELQNVEIGGSIRIRGSLYDFGDSNTGFFTESDDELAFWEQRTRLNVTADFTDDVSVFIELDNWDEWGTDFRSDYISGIDGPGAAEVALYQAYIQADNMWGTDLSLRIGRQELSFGSEWLIGVNDTSSLFYGLSFDGVRLDYGSDTYNVTAVFSKLVETAGDAFEDDVNLYAIYGTYTGLEDISIDAYWMLVSDDEVMTAFDVDLHTVGLRGAGTVGAFDFEAEVAYQFGEAELSGLFFDADIDVDAIGANVELGYTFDAAMQPRIFLGAAFFEGPEYDDGLIGIFAGGQDTLAFNRMFSNWEYTEFFANTDESNMLIIRGGVSFMPTETVSLLITASYFQADETWDTFDFFGFGPDSDDDLGVEVGVYADYQYSEDLVFRAGYAHFFAGDGSQDGQPVIFNGLGNFTNGFDALFFDDDADDFDYIYFETEISF